MKLILLTVVCFMFNNFVLAQDAKCKDLIKDVAPMSKCCKMPELADEKMAADLANEMEKKHKDQPAMALCSFYQELMKKLGLEKLTNETCSDYVLNKVKLTEPWLTPHLTSINDCIKGIPKYSQIYQDAYKIKKEQCDMQYVYFINCMHLLTFAKCPTDFFTSNEKCENSKKFVNQCAEDELIGKFFEMQ